ncbi:MAG: right-handed parallel beta-helix repeat-containing protein [Deltaproteobacteria bacterium]|nr:right-handed parallel beta-helix repeat-containing protein [Deltaproteobacteria bacterium]
MIVRLSTFLLASLVLTSTSAVHARDWFVRAGADDGDGSQKKPFADPWQALEKCEAGDAIHVTEGKYYGKLGTGKWQLPFDRVQLIGGYDKTFKHRDPWKDQTELLWDSESKTRPMEPRILSHAKDCVVDGITIDMQDQNGYGDKERTGRSEIPASETAMRFTQQVTIKNSVIINSGQNGMEIVPGSTIENNLILNALGWGISIYSNTGDFAKATATVKNNTILFSACPKVPGTGRYSGAAVQVNGPANITNNILAHSDNNAIYLVYKAEKVSVTKNVFYMNLFSNLKFFLEGRDVSIDDKSMGDLEEVGLKAIDDNDVENPKLDYDEGWMDSFSKRTASQPGKVEMDDWNKARQAMGLPLIGKGGKAASGVAPAYKLKEAMKFLHPKNPKVKAGARVHKIDVKPFAAQEAVAEKSYEKKPLLAWVDDPASVNGKAIEMIVAIGEVANIGSMPEQYKKDQILGYKLYDPDGQGKSATGFMMKGTNAERVCNDTTGTYRGQGKPDKIFVAKGIAYAVSGYPKQAFFIESIERYEPGAVSDANRPKGKDWFVRAGSTGGNGSREKPFKDPFQALEKVESGDVIHVTEGEYVGKLKVGTWKIDTTYITMLGGYSKDWKTRNPWKHPSLLYTPKDFKGRRGGYVIEGENDHTGAIVDGFVFDKKLNNQYQANGDLDYSRSDSTEFIWFARPNCTIRNNVFVNAAFGTLRVANGQLVENNIFFNTYQKSVNIESGFTTDPIVIKNNTFAFSWEIRFGEGHGRGGSHVTALSNVRAVLDNNIFEFADNDALKVGSDLREWTLTNNTFAHNLWSHVHYTTGSGLFVDDKNWKQLPEMGWKKVGGNEIISAGLDVDKKWFDTYLGRTAMVKGKVEMDDWNKLREMLGQPVIATGGKMPDGMAPAYEWKDALTCMPKNPKVKAGARAKDLPVSFDGVERKEEEHEYVEVTWDQAKDRDEWQKLDGKRVMIKIAIRSEDNQWQLDELKASHQVFTVGGPTGEESGLPLRAYVKKGTKYERVLKNAKGYTTGKPEETHILKGIARGNRQLVAEVIERAD